MRVVTPKALELAGFLLAHASWVTSELNDGELYVPQVLCEAQNGERELFVFEAETQQAAIDKAKDFLAAENGKYASCAFARDGRVNPGNGYVDVLIVDVVEGELPPKLTIIQPYRPAASGKFRLLGQELVLTDAGELDADALKKAAASLQAGAEGHPGAAEQWRVWNSERTSESPLK
jgi:hypothetical protein